eukprot:IDg5586t1
MREISKYGSAATRAQILLRVIAIEGGRNLRHWRRKCGRGMIGWRKRGAAEPYQCALPRLRISKQACVGVLKCFNLLSVPLHVLTSSPGARVSAQQCRVLREFALLPLRCQLRVSPESRAYLSAPFASSVATVPTSLQPC